MKKYTCLLNIDDLSIASIKCELDLNQNLINNLRVFCTKNKDIANKIMPSEFEHNIQNGLDIPIEAKFLSANKVTKIKIDPLVILYEQIGNCCTYDKAEYDIIFISFKLYEKTEDSFLSVSPMSEDSMLNIEKELLVQNSERNKSSENLPKDNYYKKDNPKDDVDVIKEKKYKWIILTLIIVVLVLIALLISKFWLVHESDKFEDAVTENVALSDNKITNYKQMVQNYLYTRSYQQLVDFYNSFPNASDGFQEIDADIIKTIDTIEREYDDGSETYETTKANLLILSRLSSNYLSNYVSKKLENVELINESEQSFELAQSYHTNGDYIKAIKLYQKVKTISPLYGVSQTQVANCVNELLKMVDNPKNQDECLVFMDLLDSAIELLPDNEELSNRQERISNIYKNDIKTSSLAKAKDAIKNNNYTEAFKILNDALKIVEDDELKSQLTKYQSDFETNIKSTANNYVKSNEYDKALEIIQKSLELYDSKVLKDLYADIETKKENEVSKSGILTIDGVGFIEYDGSINGDSETDTYELVAEQNGTYRFWLNNMVSGFTVKMYIYDSNGDKVGGDYNIGNNNGVTCKLSKGKNYQIQVMHHSNVGKYTLKIGQQKPTSEISSQNLIYDSIEYVDQENLYTFIPKITGRYRFDLFDVVNGFNLKLYIYDSLGYEIAGDYNLSNANGITVDLSSEERYTIVVSFYKNEGDYTLSVGYQTPTENVSDKSSISGKIEFTDQNNIYTYTPKVTGDYSFALSNIKSDMKVKMYVYDSLGYKVGGDYGLGGDSIIKNINLKSGDTYTIHITQYKSSGDYKISINSP